MNRQPITRIRPSRRGPAGVGRPGPRPRDRGQRALCPRSCALPRPGARPLGFARKLGKGLGVTVLLSGEPGTGKTMVASLIARELNLDLHVIDLSRVMSKWLGETEKNLARALRCRRCRPRHAPLR